LSLSPSTTTCLATVLFTLLRAQAPDPVKAQPPRLRLEDAFLAGARLPERVEVNGRILVVADLVQEARDAGIDDGHVARECLESLVLTVLREQLERRKAWLDDDAYEAAYSAYAEPYDKTPFKVSVIATRFKGYPSLACFQRRWRVMESCARSLPAEALGEQSLADEAVRSRDLLLGSTIEVELWFHEAAANDNGQRDFAAAHQRALATHAALAAAPAGETGRQPELAKDVQYTLEKSIMINPLRQRLRESEFTTLLREGVAEALFRAEPGKLLPPLRGADGVYVARVVRRAEGKGTVDPKNERTRELLRQLLLQRRFCEWIDDAFATSVVRLQQDKPRTDK